MIFILLVLCFPVVHAIRMSKTEMSARRPWAEMSELEQYWEAAWWTNATYDQTDANEHAILDTRYVSSNHKECVLGLRGTKDMKDWAYNLNIQVARWDVWNVHKGFATKLQKVMNDNVELINGLTNCSALIVLGHSLGGAMASLYAAGAEKYGYRKADYLYTFGAPAISTSSLHDDFNCFKGARFYNLDSITQYAALLHDSLDSHPKKNMCSNFVPLLSPAEFPRTLPTNQGFSSKRGQLGRLLSP